ncbi:MAG: 50S ribosomal protein L31 [Dehalococcoidales bacterium]|jgi:large subunit ribosomal protein L31|nr:50S ribosomal protein L31 [Dehalococcoidales bacterium]
MKEKIHPTYYSDAKVVCSCGNIITLGSTKKEMRVELCSTCHPFFTGERRIIDTAGRVERFNQRYNRK